MIAIRFFIVKLQIDGKIVVKWLSIILGGLARNFFTRNRFNFY